MIQCCLLLMLMFLIETTRGRIRSNSKFIEIRVNTSKRLWGINLMSSSNKEAGIQQISHELIPKHQMNTGFLNIRGGEDDSTDDTEENNENDEEYGGGVDIEEYDSEEEEEDNKKESSTVNSTMSEKDNVEEDDEYDGIDELDEELAFEKTVSTPIKVFIKTNLNIPLLDQKLEIIASPKRDVGSIKLSISRLMISRPPVTLQKLILGRRELKDDEILSDLIDVESDEDDSSEEEEEEVLNLVLDSPSSPIDPKFATYDTSFFLNLKEMTTREILNVYIANMVSMQYLERMFFSPENEEENSIKEEDESSIKEEDELSSFSMQKSFLNLKKITFDSLALEDDVLDSKGFDEPEDIQDNNRKHRRTIKGGAKMTIKRSLQRNLNINWADTIRNCLLFIFFGYFGTRNNSLSRVMMYWGAPMCFIVQLRVFKMFLKQVFFFLGSAKSPDIFTSLLPVPHQVVLESLQIEQYDKMMQELYPNHDVNDDNNEYSEDTEIDYLNADSNDVDDDDDY